jgi:DNA-binding IclR family transcriptional regulator
VQGEVAGIARAMKVLECVAESPAGSTVSDLSRRVGCSKGTVSKLLATLQGRQYVRQDAESGRFHLTWRLLALAFGHADRAGVPRLFMPVLQELADETDELVQLALVDGDQVLFVAKAEGPGPRIRMLPLVGMWAPVHATASGKLWLSTLDEARLRAVLGEPPLAKVAPRTITGWVALHRELGRIRKQGFATADAELVEGGRALAVPVVRDGVMEGAVALSGPAFRLSVRRLESLVPQVRAAAERLAAIWPRQLSAKDFTA